ncbi:hypothetical protein ElyMa_006872900 [Elysia marginata]|uniref:Receptor ligand binding region domain-containing protein n=1 Tax=Elysia marginata TaxID=1093978 RepID=A0AAV4JAL3_9GAST|nr:hypothetical protein ElyMa_006872900 [Elysia marginata]
MESSSITTMHMARMVADLLEECEWSVLLILLNDCDFRLFPTMKEKIRGRRSPCRSSCDGGRRRISIVKANYGGGANSVRLVVVAVVEIV